MSIFVPDSVRFARSAEDWAFKLLQRLSLWTTICTISAIPSFYFASHERFDQRAMACGVAVFAVICTISSCTHAFERIHDLAHVKATLYVGYLTRLGMSVILPLGGSADLIPGVLSLTLVSKASISPRSFIGTFMATIIQGVFLNILLFLFMAIVYVLIRLAAHFKGTPQEARGFEVVIPEQHSACESTE
jgi:hypothetical protein